MVLTMYMHIALFYLYKSYQCRGTQFSFAYHTRAMGYYDIMEATDV